MLKEIAPMIKHTAFCKTVCGRQMEIQYHCVQRLPWTSGRNKSVVTVCVKFQGYLTSAYLKVLWSFNCTVDIWCWTSHRLMQCCSARSNGSFTASSNWLHSTFYKKTHKAFATNLQANDLKCPARPRQLPGWPLPELTGLRLDAQKKAEKNQFLYP